MNEIEVFRITPIVGRCYQHVEATREQGYGTNLRYFTTNAPRYVGRFVEQRTTGLGEGASISFFFIDNKSCISI
jgi:hypothetical protein